MCDLQNTSGKKAYSQVTELLKMWPRHKTNRTKTSNFLELKKIIFHQKIYIQKDIVKQCLALSF